MSTQTIKRIVDYEVQPTPDELAEVFWSMDAEEQARFFHRLYEVSEYRLGMQLIYVVNHPTFTLGAQSVMRQIGEYGE